MNKANLEQSVDLYNRGVKSLENNQVDEAIEDMEEGNLDV